jgi:Protein of unknown function (DUF1592)/Protein of unknown function (DUF1588)/Protein of unknown function (DUF1587)/Protein of unknown function (DUF1585)/Protein of unknown function (DUF1595)/Cytochrome C oxidase, cbb3-type, subunit III
MKQILSLVGILLSSVVLRAQVASPVPEYRAVLNRYCVTCHNEKLKTAGLTLDKMDVANVPAGAEVWEKVIRKLRTRAMPPAGAPRPDPATYDALAAYLETSIDRAAAAKLNPGTPTLHRLNRTEYANSIRDLLAVEVDPATLLPRDDAGYGFDNNGDVLSVSPALMERYLAAARKISRLALGNAAAAPTVESFPVPDSLAQSDRMGEDLPLGSRGGTAIQHIFPADGEYLIQVRLKRGGGQFGEGAIRGVALKRNLAIILDREEPRLFTFGGEHYGRSAGDGGANCVTGALVSCRGDVAQEEYERNTADAGLRARIPITAGPHTVKVAFFVENTAEPEGPYRRGSTNPHRGGKAVEPWVERVDISGPYNAKGVGDTPSRSKIFVCNPAGGEKGAAAKLAARNDADEDACAKKILSNLVHRAYRRSATDEDLNTLLGMYRMGKSKEGFEGGIRVALERILVGPQFLYRIEWDPAKTSPGTPYRLSDLELASRLSFFLWSSIPDDELLSVAEQGKLKEPAVLKQEVQRMLRDPRSKALVTNFAGQWLQLRRLADFKPDIVTFPDFDGTLQEAFAEETELFLQSMVREDRPLMEILTADYTFLNERLARHYGIPNIYGSTFRRVPVTDESRRGLLGQGSILALTSYATRTSVVLRGKWVLENILGTPPPPPPPNVPTLKDRGDDGKIRSMREAMEAHRANPACASCHARMDPIGFALENFNAVGQWRTTEGGANTLIDNSGKLPDGTVFRGPSELRKILASKPDQLANTVTENLLTYALGRGVEYFDEPAVRKILREAAPGAYRWSGLIFGIVNSEPFQMRRAREL